ncbi:carbon-nitrogen hydrolase [Bisporella sp. PMI_857]|nr:carbon-nitrogen hydrolase [Bisporella sp. PMI_857]
MRIACLQFAPRVGDVNDNLNRADAVLSRANPEDLDLIVLPELAFTGYNFRSLQHISPFLEPTAAGITSLWARTAALKYNCYVTAGYPEKVDVSPKWPASPEYYNSTVMVNPDGETVAHYRKTFLYYTDETWALEGTGFYSGSIPDLGDVAMGICMDLNPYKFEAPWIAWEFSHHILRVQANLVIVSMAWLTREDATTYSQRPNDPDMETLSYWISRLEPLIRAEAEGEIIVVFANRCGVEDEAVYAGTSAVLGIHSGEVNVYGILGRGEKDLLVVDTSCRPTAKLVSQPNSAASAASSVETGASESTACTSPDIEAAISKLEDELTPITEDISDEPEELTPISKGNPGEPDEGTPASEAIIKDPDTIHASSHKGRDQVVTTPEPPMPDPALSPTPTERSPQFRPTTPPDQTELSFLRNTLGPRILCFEDCGLRSM